MHAHIGIWPLNDAGTSSSDSLAREIGELFRQQGGFHSYSLVRTGEHEVVAITMFETSAQLHDALQVISSSIRHNLRNLSGGEPERRAGDVIYHLEHREPG